MKSFFTIAFLLCSIICFAQNATIKGKISTSDGKPAEFVNVQLNGTHKGTSTNEAGEYRIERIKSGVFTIKVSLLGLETKEQQIEVKAGQTLIVDFTLAENANQLQEVVVMSNTNKFSQKETDYVARLPLKNLENPQVYTVIPKELLEEQVVTSINNALTNAVGAAPINYPAGGFAITSRGFSTGINARNGMETTASRSSVEIGNVERIEVIKGPSGTLFGSAISSFGGVVNLVTKKPFETFRGDISYTLGSYGLNRLTADINTPVNKEKTALFRVNTVVNRQYGFLDQGHNNTFLIAPSFSYQVNNRFRILADIEFLSIDQTRSIYTRVNTPSGYTNPAEFPIDYKKNLFNDDVNAETFASKYYLEANYKISNNWTSSTLFSFVTESVKHSYQNYLTWLSPVLVARNILVYGPIYNNYTNFQQNFTGNLNTGSINHKILAGVNYRYYSGSFNYSLVNNNGFIDTVNVTKAFKPLTKAQTDQAIASRGGMVPFEISDQTTSSAYVSDVVGLSDKLSAMLSLRIDNFNYAGITSTPQYSQTAFAPKLGVVYQVLKDKVSVFGNYMSGFQNQGPISQPTGEQFVAKPVYAVQSEGGIKTELLDKKLNITLSYYKIAIDNAIRRDEKGVSFQDAEQVSKGWELEFVANPFKGFNIFAGYAYNDNKIVRATDKTTEGKKAASAPENVANFWVSYKFLKNLGLGFGGYYVDKMFFSSANTFYIPSYTLLNATAFYDLPKIRFGLKINNLADQKNWDGYGYAQPLRNYALSLSVKF
ncbi:iron complex outermembrane recepter protein [Pseudarcicella hirudinis]|uniref:Iron complex outermembrane recepter protein n=1 Tax=Pseudarcicella hirudinis TaxID=1079859 RepID=A0A1I5SPM9_9BACT|nr:TonB-dependent receptor [Pseudarcicella hirudinis]SFP72591.1 iron complex outermembrane recepter protein [Pseudarcicella hirudinis]